jgi:Flp pilus assembly protein TadB
MDGRLLMRAAICVASFVVAFAVTGWLVGAVAAGALAAYLPAVLGGKAAREAQLAKIEAIATWTEMVRDTVSAGSGLSEAIRATAAVAPGPLRDAVQRLTLRMDRGDHASALRAFGDEVADPMADLVVTALVLAVTEQARRLGELLGALASAIREQAAMRHRVEAGRARTRSVATAVAGIAAVSAVGFLAFDRTYLRPYGTAAGQLVLGVVCGCFAIAFWMLGRMGRIATPERFALQQEGPR